VSIELLGKFGQRFLFVQGGKRDAGLELGQVIPSLSASHLLAPSGGRRSLGLLSSFRGHLYPSLALPKMIKGDAKILRYLTCKNIAAIWCALKQECSKGASCMFLICNFDATMICHVCGKFVASLWRVGLVKS
jgi:hypothetical protein